MIRVWGWTVVVLAGSLATSVAQTGADASSATVPNLVNFSGALSDPGGKPLTSITGVTFSLYANQEGGAPLWLETQNVQPDKNGHYSVMLGSATSQGLPSDLFSSGEARWLGVQAQGQAEQPRVMLLSVPYAMKAGDAATVGGLPPSAFVMADSPNHPSGKKANPASETQNYIPLFIDSSGDLGNSILFQSGTTEVGIGTTSPSATLEVNGTAKFDNLVGFASGQTFPGTLTGIKAGTGITVSGSTTDPTVGINTTFANQYYAQLAAANTFTKNQTVNGTMTATQLISTASQGTAPLQVTSTTVVPNLDASFLGGMAASAFQPAGSYATLGANTFTGNQTVTGAVSATYGFSINGLLFDYGTSSIGNAFLGFAGNTTTSGGENTAAGVQALQADTTGSYNTAAGFGALTLNTSGSNNTAMGQGALSTNTTGGNNTGIGYQALSGNTTGTSNTGLGDGAGFSADNSNLSQNLNTFLGVDTAFQNGATLTNATAVGANALVTQPNTIVLGSIKGINNSIANVSVGIGTTTPNATLDVEAPSGSAPTVKFGSTTNPVGFTVNGTATYSGLITFASGQTFPGTAELGQSNTFNGNLGVAPGDSFNIGNYAFAFGSYPSENAFLGFAGNMTTTGTQNTATGFQALAADSTGYLNTGTGYQALYANTLGSLNTAHGAQALAANTSGANNTALGYAALAANTTGNENTATGMQAMLANTAGGLNTADGYRAMFSNQGASNTGIGAEVLQNNSSGMQNTAAGALAMAGGTLGSDNTALGYGALYYNVGSNNTATGVQALYENVAGGNNTANGYTALYNNSTGTSNTAVGATTLFSNTTGYENTASGFEALEENTTGYLNTATGYLALQANITGTYNTATGAQALLENFGSANTATGYRALILNTSGIDNTAEGYEALYENLTGSDNTASGYQALYNNTTGSNTASGYQALYSATTGGGNTASGYQALYSDTAGSFNTAVGDFAGQALSGATLGNNNTFLGAGAAASMLAGIANATAIGSNAVVSESNALVLGCIADVNNCPVAGTMVGIGTSTPGFTLDVSYGDAIVRGGDNFQDQNDVANLYVGDANHEVKAMNATGLILAALNNPIGLVVMDKAAGCSTGFVGIQDNCPVNLLTLLKGGGAALADGWTTYSSRRWKTNIKTLPNALSKVERLRGVSYDLKDSGKHEIGVIAEEVGKVVPEVVAYEDNGKDARSVDYSRLTALLIEATKEQQALIRKQQKQIRTQQAQIKSQQTKSDLQRLQITQLMAQVKAIQASLKSNGRTSSDIRTVEARTPVMHQ